MKILHLSSALSWRGGEQQIAWLIEGLNSLNVENIVCCPKHSELEKYCQKKSIAFFTYRKRGGISMRVSKKVKSISLQEQVDLIHIHDSHGHSYAIGSSTFFGLRTPMLLSRRVDFPIGNSILSRWKYNHRSIEKIICVSHFIESLVKKSVRDKSKVVCVHDGIDISRFKNQPSGKLRKILNIGKETPIVGNIAALAPHKDHFTFVDTCQLIHQYNSNIEFVIIGGDAGTEEKMKNYIEEQKLSTKIHLLGFRKDVPELIKDIDVFLFTSKTEGLGTSVIDALAANLPVVTTAAGGIPEIITHKENGWLAKVKDATGLAEGVCFVLENPEEIKIWNVNGKNKLRGFDKMEMAKKTLAIYSEVKRNG